MRRIFRSYRPYSPLIIGGALALGALEAVALRRSQQRRQRLEQVSNVRQSAA